MRSAPRSGRWRSLQVVLVVLLGLATAVVAGRAVLAGPAAPPVGDTRPVAAFVGDSYTQGDGASSPDLRWTSLVSKARGWREVNFGRGYTGYAASSTEDRCGQRVCPPFAGMVDQVAAVDPSVVVVAGGQSDWLAWDSDEERTAGQVDALLDRLVQRFPNAQVVVVGPLQPPGADHEETVAAIAQHVRTAAEARGLVYVDLLQPNVLADGSAVADDRFNADDVGHRAIADRVLQALR